MPSVGAKNEQKPGMGGQGHSGEPGLLRKLVTSTGSIAPPWQPQAALEEGPDEGETGGQGAGLQCWVTDSPQEAPPPHGSSGGGEKRGGAGFTGDLRFLW